MSIIGNGTIKEVKPGKVYRLRHCIGKDPETGKYLKSPWRTVYCTKREARDKLARYKQELLEEDARRRDMDGRGAEQVVPTVGEYIDIYMEQRAMNKRLAVTTLQHDKYDFAHVRRLFGEIRLNELTPCIVNARCSSYRTVEGVSLNVLNRTIKALKALYRRAMREGLVSYSENPCPDVDVDRPDNPQRRSLTPNEMRRMRSELAKLDLDGRVVAVVVGLATGMRKGEVLGLEWGDVDLESGRISIMRQYTQECELKKPKSKAGMRSICIDEDTRIFLLGWKRRQALMLDTRGRRQHRQTPVASNADGDHLYPRSFSRWFKAFSAKTGFNVCFHELRHSQATLLIANNCDIKTVQHRLGHADVETTLNIYTHVVDANDEAAARLVGSL